MTTVDDAIGFQAVNRSSVASLAFLLWDICITMDDEVTFIWPNRWTFAKCLYLFVRYVPLFVQISILFTGSEISRSFHYTPNDCNIWGVFQVTSAMVISLAVDWVLMLRVNALYHGNRGIRLLLAFLFIFESVGMGVGLGLTTAGAKYDNDCTVLDVPKTLIVYGLSTLLVQVILFILTVIRFFTSIRSGRGILVVDILVRDGTWAFFLVAAVEVGHGGLFLVKNRALSGVLYGWALTIFSFSGYRILLNLRRLTPENSRMTTHRSADIEIQFAPASESDSLSIDESVI